MTKFSDLRLSEPILRAVTAEGYSIPTPIQAQAIPHVLDGRDLLGVAQTGTGKTAAFALPILDRLSGARAQGANGHGRRVRCLVLSPTRELASQIGDSFRAYGKNTGIHHSVVFGGVGQGAQVQALRRGVDVLVATPGRLLDLMNQGFVDLRGIEVFVLDEADRMLDMGFINDIRKVVAKLPRERQTLMFSATMPPDIRDLANTILRNPVSVHVSPVAKTADRIEQSVYFVEKKNKPRLLAHLLNQTAFSRCLVFTRTKHGADRVAKHLNKVGIAADAIHGNKSQNQRERALANFKNGKTAVLIASDIASRGIDIDDISHVVNYDLSNEPETYVHRIGRTARAGASGVAVSFCDNDERPYLAAIEKLTRQKLVVKIDHPHYPAANEQVERAMRPQQARQHSQPHPQQHATPRHPTHPQRLPHVPRHRNEPATAPAPAPRTHRPERPASHPRRSHPLHGPSTGPGAAPEGMGVRFHGRKRNSRR
jgi:ATP-dependent RNA helicase RhlE